MRQDAQPGSPIRNDEPQPARPAPTGMAPTPPPGRTAIADPFALVTEAEAYRLFPLLEDKELRRARAAGLIGYLRRKRTIHYRRDELESFVRTIIERGFIEPCQIQEGPRTTPARTTTPHPTPPASATAPACSDTVTEDLLRRAYAKLSR